MNLLFFQTGDYAEAYDRFSEGGAETYRDQRASVMFVADLARTHQVTTVSRTAPEHDRELAPGLRSVAIGRQPLNRTEAAKLLDRLAPDALVLRTPDLAVLQAACARGIAILPCFADLFTPGGVRNRWYNWQLSRLLKNAGIPCVANHSLNASRAVIDVLGYRAARTVPWDWTRLENVAPARNGLRDPATPSIFYAGALSADKGVGDCLEALQLLHHRDRSVEMTFAGPGDLDGWRTKARDLGLEGHVKFLGQIPHAAVRTAMAEHDMVIVPSRHSYPEGLPNVIYEGLAARSPLLVSDHPAFAGRLTDGTHCLQFRAGDPDALAGAVGRLCDDPALFRRLSEQAAAGLEGLYVGLEWATLIELFLRDPNDSTGWVGANSMATLQG